MLSEKNRILVEVVDGWAIGEECDLPLDRIEALMNAARQDEARAGSVEGLSREDVAAIIANNRPAKSALRKADDILALFARRDERIAALEKLLGWARCCVPFPSDCHSAIVAALQPNTPPRVAHCGGEAIRAMLDEDE